uniref:Rho-related GTP-binding protein RhoU n=1 Tax=Trichuris muris TaxID=70415 RepID=A0A5S6QYL1_TRIMR
MVEKLGSNCASPSLGSDDGGKPIKCVLVGDGAVGKTSLIVSYTTNGYPQEYVPTAFDNYSVLVTVNERPVRLQLCDTAGQEDFDTLRHLCYPNSHVILLCFSVVCPASFSNILQRWLPECDLRTNVQVLVDLNRFREAPVSSSEAQHAAKKINAVQYIECSALTQVNLKEVFDVAILAALNLTEPVKPKIFVHHVKARMSMRRLKQKLTRPSSVEALQHPSVSVKRHLSSTSAIPALIESIGSQQVISKLPFRKGGGTSGSHGPAKSKWTPKIPADTETKERTGWRRFLCFS